MKQIFMAKVFSWLAVMALALAPALALAHEAYVMESSVFWQGLRQPPSWRALEALQNPHNLHIALGVSVGILALLTVNFLFRLTTPGQKLDSFFERFAAYGPMFVRFSVAAALFLSALNGSFLGPELSLSVLPLAESWRWGLFVISALIFLGLFVEMAALVGLVMFIVGFFVFGGYLATYLNYLGEFVVLLLFGMRHWSLDAYLFGKLHHMRLYWERYETTIVRVFYGLALIYAGISVKFLHPDLTVAVARQWHLAQFHWLFPSDPLLITLGAGVLEVVIGFFILVGFEMRMTVIITLFYITLSLLYFQEMVWPHLMLYGISLNLLVQPEILTLDHFIFTHHRAYKKWWRRVFEHHTDRTKSTIATKFIKP